MHPLRRILLPLIAPVTMPPKHFVSCAAQLI
jgi:hypothetical protein